jgi:formylglycine-generating enzyme required for sulfatase activity
MRAATTLLLLVASCATPEGDPLPQALVFVDTDAVPSLFDRVRITVTDDLATLEPACDACTRETVVESVEDWPLSFGVEAPADGRLWVHAIVFPLGRTHVGQVLPETAVEKVAELRWGDGIVAQEVFLSLACVDRPIDRARATTCTDGETADVEPAALRDPDAPTRAGTFRAEFARDCATEPTPDSGLFDGEVCIRGGTFWMGDVRRQGLGGHFDAVPEHLVTVSPFMLDRHEYTTGRYRAALAGGFTSAERPWTVADHPDCTFRPTAPEGDDLPLNCVSGTLAAALCEFEGRRLPTEAEWEWAGGGRELERLNPWEYRVAPWGEPEERPAGPAPVGSRTWDVSADGVLDMGYNVGEWLVDRFQLYTDPCWEQGAYGPDPVCVPGPGEPDHGRAARGDYWFMAGDSGAGYFAMVPARQTWPDQPLLRMGLRCARSDG